MNKRVVLLVLILCISIVFVGCKKKAPEGVSQDFYDDMVKYSDELIKIVKNAKTTTLTESDILENEYYEGVVGYTDNIEDLTLLERQILESIEKLYFYAAMQCDGARLNEEITEEAKTFSKLMEIDFDVDDLLLE